MASSSLKTNTKYGVTAVIPIVPAALLKWPMPEPAKPAKPEPAKPAKPEPAKPEPENSEPAKPELENPFCIAELSATDDKTAGA